MFRLSGSDGAVNWAFHGQSVGSVQYIGSTLARELQTKQKQSINRLYNSLLPLFHTISIQRQI